MIMRATQKKMMSKPVTSTDEGRNVLEVLASRPASRARRTAPAPRRTRCRARRGRAAACRCLPARLCARASASVRADVDRCRRRRTTPGSGGPTRAGARCTSPGCSRATGCRSWSSARERTSPRPCATASRPVLGQAVHLHEPLVGEHRLDDRRRCGPSAAPCSLCGFFADQEALAARGPRRTRLRASKRSSPRILLRRRCSFMLARRA